MAISGLGREEDILVDEVVAQEAAAAQAHEEFHALEEILTVCHDPGKGTDLCDLVLVPAGIHPGKERGSICRPPMSKARVRDIMQRGAALGVVT